MEIQYSEFLAATMDMNHAIREENIMRAFQQFDKSGSGCLSIPDLIAIMGSEEHAREVAGEIDLNGDGVISYEEFKAMMQVRMVEQSLWLILCVSKWLTTAAGFERAQCSLSCSTGRRRSPRCRIGL